MLIGIAGKIGSGKDTVFKLMDYLAYNGRLESLDLPVVDAVRYARTDYETTEFVFENKKFAAKIKSVTARLLGCEPADLEDRKFKESSLGPEWDVIVETDDARPGWSQIHNDLALKGANYTRRSMTPRLFMQLLGTDFGREIVHPDFWVKILMNEYNPNYSKWIVTDVRFPNEADGIKKAGGKVIRVLRPGIAAASDHVSETALDNYTDFDAEIDNSGDFYHLAREVDRVCVELDLCNAGK